MVIDASVWVSALGREDEHHLPSRQWLSRQGVARVLRVPLVTWDGEMRDRAGGLAAVLSP